MVIILEFGIFWDGLIVRVLVLKNQINKKVISNALGLKK